MKLIDEEVKKRFKAIGKQGRVKDPIIVVQFFNPAGATTWYATEYDEKRNICYGYVTNLIPTVNGDFDEWGYFSIDELEEVRLPFRLKIERNLYVDEKPISQFVNKIRLELELEKIKKLKKTNSKSKKRKR